MHRTTAPTVFCLAAGHNERTLVRRLFQLLSKQSYPNLRFVFVDDGSTDGTSEYLKKTYPDLHLLHGDGNLWWTGSMHRGVAEILHLAQPNDFVLTLNNDCTFNNEYISTLVKTSNAHSRAVVGSLAIDRDNPSVIWDAGVRVDWAAGVFRALEPKNVAYLPHNVDVTTDINTVSTKGTLYPVEVFQRAGNFDAKHLPHYGSDYEMGCRANRAGFQLVLSYRARVYNEVRRTGFGQTIGQSISFAEFHRLMFGRRSQVNVVDHFQLVQKACPLRYKPINYLRIVGKFCYYLAHVPPFTLFLPILQWLKRLVFPLQVRQSNKRISS